MSQIALGHGESINAPEKTRYFANRTLALPMLNYTIRANCRCRFKKYVDRRDDEEGRRFRYGLEQGAWYAGSQRRKSSGRRDKD